jgi:DNA-binding transcriptional regulator YhcF (GntR family)
MDLSNAAPIERRKLSHSIEERLLARLQSGDMLPGDVLPSERELMTLFGVGRPAVREAMQNLERMGLIEIRHGERPRVAKPSLERTLSQLGETMRHILIHSASSLEHLKQARSTFDRGPHPHTGAARDPCGTGRGASELPDSFARIPCARRPLPPRDRAHQRQSHLHRPQ